MLDPQFPAEVAPQPISLLNIDGRLADGVEPPMEDKEILEALRLMLLSRRFDAMAFSLQRQGKFGTYSPVHGQEASVVGASSALDPDRDWVVPQYRELPALLRQGLPLERFILYFIGHPDGGFVPEGVNVLPIQIGIAAQLPHAVGLGWGLRHQKKDGVVLAFCGEGATSEGDFHEACNLAGVRRAPVIFLIQNNGWAISTPYGSQTAARNLAARAPGYGFPGVVVDGNDLFAVHAVVDEAVRRARKGEGPTLVEALTFRMGPHNTADDPTRYLEESIRKPWNERDPLLRVQRYLQDRGLWDDAAAESAQAEIDEEIQSALEAAWEHPKPTAVALIDNVYAQPSERLARQRNRLDSRE